MKRVTIYAKVPTKEQNAGLTVENEEYDLECNKAEETYEHG